MTTDSTPARRAQSAEHRRLAEADAGQVRWRRWGPYLAERQWGTVREDYSANGDAWNYFPHDHARSRVYRWGEDGIAGFSDDELIDFMMVHPILINRPIVVTGKGALLARPSERVLDILANPDIGEFVKEDGEIVPPRDRKGLRSGYTTGACSAAAAVAAATALAGRGEPRSITIHLPAGRDATFAVWRLEIADTSALASVIKDGGDDPDVTHGAEICVRVRWVEQPGLHLRGGPGVGTVTRPGPASSNEPHTWRPSATKSVSTFPWWAAATTSSTWREVLPVPASWR